jgi:hypothetical protein
MHANVLTPADGTQLKCRRHARVTRRHQPEFLSFLRPWKSSSWEDGDICMTTLSSVSLDGTSLMSAWPPDFDLVEFREGVSLI